MAFNISYLKQPKFTYVFLFTKKTNFKRFYGYLHRYHNILLEDYFFPKTRRRVSMLVIQGTCFCWCIACVSGVLDSKSKATF